MFIVKNLKTGHYIKHKSGSFSSNLLAYKNGYGSSCWTSDINKAKVYKTKAGIKNSVGIWTRTPEGKSRGKMVLPDWVQIIPIEINRVIKGGNS